MSNMQSAETIRNKRRVTIERAKLTWNRNQVLRLSSTGRLLLLLERCLRLSGHKGGMNSRRGSRLLNDLSYACELADEAGVQHGWISEGSKTFSLVFAVSSGDVVFNGLNQSLGSDPFSRPLIASDNTLVLTRAIAEILSQQTNSAMRRSTRIPADVLIEVQGERCAYAGETIAVNLHGALVRIAAPLKLGDQVRVYVHETGRSASGAVVFADFATLKFGIELENPENIWGIAVTPLDWHSSEIEQSAPELQVGT